VTDPLMRSESFPRYAHDGSYLYFTGEDSLTGCYGVWRARPDGTALEHVVADTSDCGPYVYQQLTPTPDYASSPSPDGTQIAYVNRTLRMHTLATAADTSLGVVGDLPRWSPTGEWIAYDSLGTLMLIHPDGTGRQALLFRGDPGLPGVDWSPDGQWLVYWGYDLSARFGGLHLVQVSTGLQLPLGFARGLAEPTWQP
jgi:Tol biopolymer transport system component